MSQSLTHPEIAFLASLDLNVLARQAAEPGGEYHVDRAWLERFTLLVAALERKACIEKIEGERVDAESSTSAEDVAYNNALVHAVDAVRARLS